MTPPLPQFVSVRARKQTAQYSENVITLASDESYPSEQTKTARNERVNRRPGMNHKRNAGVVSSVSFLIAFVFLLLVIIGQVSKSQRALLNWFFFELDISDIYPSAFGSTDIVFVNSIARSLGLHDFYRVGLWNFCEGYNDEGVTYCSPPQSFYYFNPVTILLNELLYGATITLPSQVVIILTVVQVLSSLMFGFFLTAAPMLFICIFLAPLATRSKRISVPVSVFSTLAAVLVLAGSIIATVMFLIFEVAVTSQTELNIRANLGVLMLVFMWAACGAAAVGAHLHLCMCCCCRSRKSNGSKRGSRPFSGEKSRNGGRGCCGLRGRATDVV